MANACPPSARSDSIDDEKEPGPLSQDDFSRVLKVCGINQNTSDQTLTSFFENKRKSGGGDVVRVQRKNASEAIIEFKDANDACKVLKHGALKLEECDLSVAKYNSNEERKKRVIITGLHTSTSTDAIECFFESKRYSGGGEIEVIKYNTGSELAEITFKDHEDAARVVKSKEIYLEGSPLMVVWASGGEEDGGSSEPETDENESSPKEDLILEVTGLKKKITDALCKCYFANKKRSGGGDIKEFQRINKGTARLVYRNNKDAERILEKGHCTLNQVPLKVKKLTQLKEQSQLKTKRTVMLTGHIGSFSEDSLILYLEEKSCSGGGPVSKLKLNSTNESALVTFETPEDAEQCVQRREFLLESKRVRASWPDSTEWGSVYEKQDVKTDIQNPSDDEEDEGTSESDTDEDESSSKEDIILKITGLNKNITDELCKCFFANNKRSGGGDIKEFHRINKKSARVVYHNNEDAKRILESGKFTLNKALLKVHQMADPKQKAKSSSKRTVMLTGPIGSFSEESLTLHLEDKSCSGGGPVSRIILNATNGSALVTFEFHKDAENCVQKKNVLIERKRLRATWPDSTGSAKGAAMADNKMTVSKQLDEEGGEDISSETDTDEDESSQDFVLEVTGLNTKISDELLKCFFSNKKRSGGGDIKEFQRIEKTSARLVYTNYEDGKRILEKGNFTCNKVNMTVTKMAKPKSKTQTSSPCTVILTGPIRSFSEESLAIHCEDKSCFGGSSVSKIELNASNESALVTFETPEEANRCVQKAILHIGLETLMAKWPGSAECETGVEALGINKTKDYTKPIAAIEVTCSAETGAALNAEVIRAVFESKRFSGGGEIKSLNFYEEEGVALVSFSNTEDAKEVLRRSSTEPIKALDFEFKVRCLETEVPSGSCAIEIQGFSADTDKYLLKQYFQNHSHSGGGPIDDIYLDAAHNRAVITFKDIKVPPRVLQREPHELNDCTMNVKLLKPVRPTVPIDGPIDESKILVSRIDEDMSTAGLLPFLKMACPDCHVKRVMFGNIEGQALVEFDGIPNFEAVRTTVNMKPFDGRMLQVQQVPLPNGIQVHGIQDIRKDPLTFYFEDETRSNGGKLEIKHFCAKDDYAILIFDDLSVIDKVLSKLHVLNDTELKVSVFHECLGLIPPGHDTSKPPTRIPSAIDITDTDPDILAFIEAFQKQAVEQELAPKYCLINWPKNAKEPVNLTCTITRRTIKTAGNPKEWVSTVTDVWYNSILKRYRKTKIDILQVNWKEFLQRVGDLSKQEEEDVKINKNDTTCSVQIWGKVEAVEKKAQYILTVQQTIEQELDRAKKSVTERIVLKPHEICMLRAVSYQEKEEANHSNIVIKISDRDVALTGLPNEIKEAKLAMNAVIDNILSEIVPNVPESVCRLLGRTAIRDPLFSQLKKNNIQIAWSTENNYLTVYAMNINDLKRGIKVITGEVMEAKINVPKDVLVLQGDKWKIKQDSLLDNYPDTLEISVRQDNEQISVASINDQCNMILEEIKNFIAENTIMENVIGLERGKYRLAEKDLAIEMHKISSDMKSMLVDIKFKTVDDEYSIVVNGNKFGIIRATKRVQDVIGNIAFRDKDIMMPGMSEYFVSKRGRDFILSAESRHTVTIELVTGEVKARHTAVGKDRTIYKAKLKSGTEIFVCVGDITTFQVGTIVNAANEKLCHAGGLAKAIVQNGGDSIQKECSKHIANAGKLLPGQVFTSEPGDLPCKKIIHAVGPKWQGGDRGEENYIYEAIYQCLIETVKHKLDSIAIPALSTGIFGVPMKLAIDTIVNAIKDYSEQETDSTILTKVFLVDNLEEPVKQFHESVQDILGENAGRLLNTLPVGRTGFTDHTSSLGSMSTSPVKALYKRKDHMTLVTAGRVEVSLRKGCIEKQQVDVIVNTTSQNIDGNAGVSGAIFKGGGPELLTEAKKHAPLKPGEIAITSGHNLPCQKIYHAWCSGWDGSNMKCERFIKQIIADSISTASQSGFTSIAFPAIGTGNHRVPHDKCAAMLYEVVAINRHTSVNDVRFVIHEKDVKACMAFKEEMQRQVCPSHAEAGMSRSMKENISVTPGESLVGINQSVGSPGGLQVTLGRLVLQLELGDITKECTDAIVNSTNAQMDLSQGGVAKALASAGGPSFQQECQQTKMTGNMAITSGGNLRVGKVIHIAAPQKAQEWRSLIINVLKKAEVLNITSIAFPALGTGAINLGSSVMASTMLDAIDEFADDNPVNLNVVRIIVFAGQPNILDTFRMEITKKGNSACKYPQWWRSLCGIKQGVSRKFNYSDNLSIPRPLRANTRASMKDNHPLETPSAAASAGSISTSGISAHKMWIYATSNLVLDEVMNEIDDLFDDECKDKIMDSASDQANIAKLNDTQAARIQNLEQEFPVTITIERSGRVKRIRVQGSHEAISSVIQSIYQIFIENKDTNYEQSKAEILQKQVQWMFEDGEELREYPTKLNAKIEEAFDLGEPEVEWEEENDKTFKINFSEMTESQEARFGPKVKVHRKTRGGGVELPLTWTPVEDPSEDYECVPIMQGRSEYEDVADKFKQTADLTDKTITKIERVQNSFMYQKYIVTKDSMKRATGTGNVETMLWHGTSEETLHSIYRYGFNRSYCGKNAAMLGNGVYFAKLAEYSCQNTYSPPDDNGEKHIILCKVLTGEYTKGSLGMRVPPVKSAPILYDSVVDDVNKPSIYVIFNDTQAYPEYHITFK